jgi:RNA 3'-terminal phosphate cyclase
MEEQLAAEVKAKNLTSKVSPHLDTNIEVARLFLPVQIAVSGGMGEPGTIRISSASLARKRNQRNL